MANRPLSYAIKRRVHQAARQLGTEDPVPYVGTLIDRSFRLPEGHPQYGQNNLTPGTAPFEPSFSEREPHTLRFTVEPAGPGAHPLQRRDDATREMRRLVDTVFGGGALRWFDQSSEQWRALFSHPRLAYGAWFGTAYDRNGLHASKIYYELDPADLTALPNDIAQLVRAALQTMPGLIPVFTTITAYRSQGRQRVTFLHTGPLRLAELGPLLDQLSLGHRLPSIMQIVGLTLGGRFTLPPQSVLIGLSGTLQNPELKLEILLGMIDDVPAEFPQLLRLGLAERPQQLMAMERWYEAFTPENGNWPGNLSVLSVRVTPDNPAQVSVYLRPVEFELNTQLLEYDASG
ncbi:MAG: hypothetical protein R3293_27520 [Candidatus Promineifilaceae bacterium]|nr:hypothetical protein [Candidatus Promineifilaceae bacterium]